MNKNRKIKHGILFFLCYVLTLSMSLYAQQQKKISGTIFDTSGYPLTGATVAVDGSSAVAISDVDGKFSINIQGNKATLKITYLGFIPVTTKIDSDSQTSGLVIKMEENTKSLDDVIVIGYGSLRKRDVTGAISSVSAKDIELKTPTSVYDALKGQVAGVQIISGSGAPGESSTIKIRGGSTFSEAGNNPLFIIDGVPMESIDDVNPGDIKSMEILKDAASASIYGSRSANGVIIITTKEGELNKPRVSLKYSHSWGKLSHKLAQSNRDERILYDGIRRQYFEETGLGNAKESDYIKYDPLNAFFLVDNDYQDMLFGTSQKDDVSFSISGGEKQLKYYATVGFFNEQGIVPNTSYQRLNSRVNTDYNATKWLSLGSRLSVSYAYRDRIDEGNLLNSVLQRIPYYSTHYPDGDLVGIFNGQRNPIAQVMYTTDKTDYITANFYQYFKFNITKDLSFRTNINGNYYANRNKNLLPGKITIETELKNSGGISNSVSWNWMNENILTYARSWNQTHSLQAIAGFSLQRWTRDWDAIKGNDSATDYIYTGNAFVSNLNLSNTGNWVENNSLASVFARVEYDYKKKYLLAANIRSDGSSRFASNNKWGHFPSVSAGWRFSDELFFDSMKPLVDDAKLRVSYGITGNQQIGNYDYVYTYQPGGTYDGLGSLVPTRIQSDDLKWEKTKQFNIGLDWSFLENRLMVNVDYYDKLTEDLLVNFQLPKESGFGYIRTNIGSVRNKGYEISISGDIIRKKDLTWNASFNINGNANKIETLSQGRPVIDSDLWYLSEGGKIGDFYGYKQLGIFKYNESNAFTSNWEQLTPVFEDGVFQGQYLLNGTAYTGEVLQKKLSNGDAFRGGDVNWEEPEASRNGTIDDNDRMIIGNALPDLTGGFSTQVIYKGIGLFLAFNYSLGGDIYNYAEHQRNRFTYSGPTPAPHVIHNIWTQQGDDALYPRPYNDEYNNARMANSFYVEDGSFVKLQTAKLSYTLDKKMAEKLKMKKCALYVYGNNLLTWTNYSGFDPEFSSFSALQIGRDTNRYPKQREIGLGIDINF